MDPWCSYIWPLSETLSFIANCGISPDESMAGCSVSVAVAPWSVTAQAPITVAPYNATAAKVSCTFRDKDVPVSVHRPCALVPASWWGGYQWAQGGMGWDGMDGME